MSNTITGFKAFDKNLKCRDFQYEIEKQYSHSSGIKVCESGFHFCENPLDVFNYYPPTSRFGLVEGDNFVKNEDKTVAQNIRIIKELKLSDLVKEGVAYISAKAKIVNGANSATSGDRANSATSGNRANSATSGDGANSATSGSNSIAAGIGINNKVKSVKGNWIVLSEWIQKPDYTWEVKTVKTAKIDGKKLKENTWYKLKDGKFVACEEND